MRFLPGSIFVLLLLLPGGPTWGQLLLNEVFYDPPGSDGGREFVELYVAASQEVSLDGVRLVFVNGASPDEPRTVWRAPEGLVLEAGRFWVVGGEEVEGRDATASLSLQNGPDALWLMRGEDTLDRVAWGEVEGLGEGAPAADVSGASLGRVPDGSDSDDNARDWRRLDPPSPGRINAPAVRLRLGRIDTEPPFLPMAGVVLARCRVQAEGWAARQEAALRWLLDGRALAEAWLALDLGDTATAQVEFSLPVGRHLLQAREELDGAVADSVSLVLQVGPASVVLNELMARPLEGRPEWIELHARQMAPPLLRGWSICDATRQWHALPDIVLPPDGYVLLCPDPAGLREAFELPTEVEVVTPAGGWPSLNNSQSSGASFADEVLLRDGFGAVVDRLAYGEELVPEAGRSIERGLIAPDTPVAWFVSPAAPSPGRPNPSAQVALPQAGLRIEPNPFTPDGDGQGDLLHIVLRHGLDGRRVTAGIYDLQGGRVRLLGADEGGGALRQWLWDGRDERGRAVPMGAYVVVVDSGGEGRAPQRWTALVALGRRR